MEIYVAYKDYNWMMEFTERMLEKICLDVNGTTDVKVGDNVISFKAPFPRVTMAQAIKDPHRRRHNRHGRGAAPQSRCRNGRRDRTLNGQG